MLQGRGPSSAAVSGAAIPPGRRTRQCRAGDATGSPPGRSHRRPTSSRRPSPRPAAPDPRAVGIGQSEHHARGDPHDEGRVRLLGDHDAPRPAVTQRPVDDPHHASLADSHRKPAPAEGPRSPGHSTWPEGSDRGPHTCPPRRRDGVGPVRGAPQRRVVVAISGRALLRRRPRCVVARWEVVAASGQIPVACSERATPGCSASGERTGCTPIRHCGRRI
jgi:hypothetical protein